MPKAGATHIPVHFGGEMEWYAVSRRQAASCLTFDGNEVHTSSDHNSGETGS